MAERGSMNRAGSSVRSAFAVVALALAAALSACGSATQKPTEGQEVVRVPEDASTISGALDKVAPGGLVLVGPGVYREKVTITTEGVTLRGTDRSKVIIDGEGMRTYGVLGAADGVRIENLTATQALLYGVLVTSSQADGEPLAQGADGYEAIDPDEFPPLQRFRVDHVTATNNGLYGIYAFNAQHGVIANSVTSGSADSGIYVGQCRECDIVVEGNLATRNAIGFENANASDSVTLVGNRFSGNRVGMTLTSDYQEAFTPQKANVVIGNVISDNRQADSPRQADGGFGIGIGVAGGRDNVIGKNLISGHPLAGVVFNNAEDLPAAGNKLTGNIYTDNGVDIANVSASRTPASRNCFEGDVSTAPVTLGGSCSDDRQPVAGNSDLPAVVEPPGVAFLDVTPPHGLPSMKPDSTVPAPLPERVTHPTIDQVSTATNSLLRALLAAWR